MKMMLTRPERLALLLHLMGAEATDIARSGLSGDALEDLEQALEDFRSYPPAPEEIDMVLEDFQSYFELALKAAGEAAAHEEEAGEDEEAEGEDEAAPTLLRIAEDHFDVELEPRRTFEKPSLTGDTVHDLNHVHPYQVAHALKNENPAAIAIVLRELANQHAAKTLEFLPEHVRPRVFLELAEPPRVTPVVQDCILRKTLELALEVEERTEDAESSEQMANLMRSLPRKLRGPMLDELANKDADLADAVKKQLYRFDDIEKLTDRDMQTLLGHCNSDTLVLALQQVEESLLVKVLSNMSKRAKETLQEEMQFKVNAAMDEIEEARRHVANSLAQLCESGDIKLD